MIDIHCHILSGMDDGARNPEMSLQMCKIAEMNNIKHIVATPHINVLDDIERFIAIRDERLQFLRNEINKRNINVNVYPGAEVYVDDDIFFANNLKRLTINGSRYLLVEFSFRELQNKKIYDYLNEIIKMGLIPIIAHPERYQFFQYDYEAVNDLSRRGAIFQINAASLASMDGPQEFELAYSMAYNGIASFIGTDAHSSHHRPNNLKDMMRFFPPDISQFNMQMMVHDNAKCVLTDKELPVVDRGEIFRRGF